MRLSTRSVRLLPGRGVVALCGIFLLAGCGSRQSVQQKIDLIELQWQQELAESERARIECRGEAMKLPEGPERRKVLILCREDVHIRSLAMHNIREAMDQRIMQLKASQ